MSSSLNSYPEMNRFESLVIFKERVEFFTEENDRYSWENLDIQYGDEVSVQSTTYGPILQIRRHGKMLMDGKLGKKF